MLPVLSKKTGDPIVFQAVHQREPFRATNDVKGQLNVAFRNQIGSLIESNLGQRPQVAVRTGQQRSQPPSDHVRL